MPSEWECGNQSTSLALAWPGQPAWIVTPRFCAVDNCVEFLLKR